MIQMTIKGAPETMAVLSLLPNRLKLALFKGMRDTVIIVQSLAKKNAPVWRGLLRASIVQTVIVEDNKILGQVGSALPYADVIEKGRDTGWLPNINSLRLWARRRLRDEHAGYAVAKSIQRRGFRAQPYLKPAEEEGAPRAQLVFNARILEALAELGGG